MTFYVVDAHALLWFLEDNPRLGSAAGQMLSDGQASFGLPAIALAEALRVIELGKSKIPTPADLLRALDADDRFGLIPLDRAVLDRFLISGQISEIHDRLIVATALEVHSAGNLTALITADKAITASAAVPVIW